MRTFTLSSAALTLAMCAVPAWAQSRLGVSLDTDLRTDSASLAGNSRESLGSSARLPGAGTDLFGSGSSSLGLPTQVPANGATADAGTDLKRATRKTRRDLIDDASRPTATVQAPGGKASARPKAGNGK